MAASTNQLIGIATTLQNKVGTALTSAQTLLPAPEYASAVMQAGASGMVANILISLKQGQEHLLKLTSKVSGLLQAQVDASEEMARIEADRLAEELKEKMKPKGGTGIGSTSGANVDLDDAAEGAGGGLGKWLMGALMAGGTGLGAWIGTGGAARFMKGFGMRLIKGGFYGIVAGLLAEPIITFLEQGVFKKELDPDDKKMLVKTITVGAIGWGLAGLPGMMIGIGGLAAKHLTDYLTGEERKLTYTHFLAIPALLAGVSYLSSAVVAMLPAGTAVAGLVGAIGAAPVLLAVGLAMTAAIGLTYLKNKMDDYELELLGHMKRLTDISQEEFVDGLKNQERKFIERVAGERIALLFGDVEDISESGQLNLSMQAARKKVKKGKELDFIEKEGVAAVHEKMAGLSDEDLGDLLKNPEDMEDIMRIMSSLKFIAVGTKDKAMLTSIFKFNDRIKTVAADLVEQGFDKENRDLRSLAQGASKGLDLNIPVGLLTKDTGAGTDVLEAWGEIQDEVEAAEKNMILATEKLQAAGAHRKSVDDGSFLKWSTDEEKAADALILIAEREYKDAQRILTEINKKKHRAFMHAEFDMDDLKEIFTDAELKDMIKKSLNNTLGELKPLEKDIEHKEFPFLSHTNVANTKKLNNITMTDSHMFQKSDAYLSNSVT